MDDNGISVSFIGLAWFGSAGSVSGAAGSASVGSSVCWLSRAGSSKVVSGWRPSGLPVCSSSTLGSSSSATGSSGGLVTRAFLLGLAFALQTKLKEV